MVQGQFRTKRMFPTTLIAVLAVIALLPSHSIAQGVAETPPQSPIPDHLRSDSPFLRLSADELDTKPVIPPSPKTVPVTNTPRDTVIYDTNTRREIVIPKTLLPEAPNDVMSSYEPFEGVLPNSVNLNQESVLGIDDRTQITNTTDIPWRTIAKLTIKYPGSIYTYSCTGAMVDDFHILTAGHCVHNSDQGGWYSWIEVYPGQNGSETPFHKAFVVNARSYTGWTENQDPEDDIALITLDRSIGYYTGWMGRRNYLISDSAYTDILNVSGYPGDKPAGTQWFDSDYGDSVTDTKHFYYMDTAGGQSGAPVWQKLSDTDDRYILSVHTNGDTLYTPGITNAGTRLNGTKFTDIETWRLSDSSPADKPDLIDDGAIYSSFSPTSGLPNQSISVYSDVRNIGTADTNGFYVSYYASTDTNITSSDYYLGQIWVPEVTPFHSVNADLNGSLPANIPLDRRYYIGWIIDSSGTNAEFDETNNTAYISSPTLTVGTVIDETCYPIKTQNGNVVVFCL